MKFIKNLFRPVVKIALACVLAFTGFQAAAQTPAYVTLLNGGALLVPWAPASNTTTNFNQLTTNALFYAKGYTQTNSSTYPYVSGYYNTWYLGAPFTDAGLWCDRDGTTPSVAFNATVLGPTTGGQATNTLLFTLTTINKLPGDTTPNGPVVYNNQAQNQFSCLFSNAAKGTNAAGNDMISISTNLPTGFLTGALAVTLQITTYFAGTNAGPAWTNVTGPYNALVTNTVSGWEILNAGLSGYKPTQN